MFIKNAACPCFFVVTWVTTSKVAAEEFFASQGAERRGRPERAGPSGHRAAGRFGLSENTGGSMSIGILALLAVIPIIVALVLMVGLRWPATRAMPVAWLALRGLRPGRLETGCHVSVGAFPARRRDSCGRVDYCLRRHSYFVHPGKKRRHGDHPARHAECKPRPSPPGHHHRLHVRRIHRRRSGLRALLPPSPLPCCSLWASRHGRGRDLPCVQLRARDLRRGGHARSSWASAF